MSTSRDKDYRPFSTSSPPVHIRDCLNFSFIAKYTLHAPGDHPSIGARLRHYLILLDMLVLTFFTTATSWRLGFASRLESSRVLWQICAPAANILSLWLVAWGIMVLRDVYDARDLCLIKVIGMAARPWRFTLSLGRKYFDWVIGMHLTFSLCCLYLLWRFGLGEEAAKGSVQVNLWATMVVAGGVLSARTPPRTIEDE